VNLDVFHFLNLYKDGRTPRTGDQPVARPIPTHRATETQNKHTQTSMPRVGFDPSVRASEDGLCLRPRGHSDWQETTHGLW
jgi:hypothetical protein